MCYSATASFVAAALLIPVGVYTFKEAAQSDPRYLGFAAFPLVFGVQQAFEGGVWLALGRMDPVQTRWFAVGFLFFAYFLWPSLAPLATHLVERNARRRRLFLGLSACGAALGLALFVPLFFLSDPLTVRIERHSIFYGAPLIWDGSVSGYLVRAVYSIIVCLPLLLSSVKAVRLFGALITFSASAGFLFAQYAFTSIWCFMAAVASVYILFVVRRAAQRRIAGPGATLNSANTATD